MKKIFIDSDVILDLFLKRKPFYVDASRLFVLLEKKRITGYTSPVIMTNLFYILSRLKNKVFARKTLKKLRIFVHILPMNEKIIDVALLSHMNDFEDATQLYTALENNVAFLITRNKDHYKDKRVTALYPGEYIHLLFTTGKQTAL